MTYLVLQPEIAYLMNEHGKAASFKPPRWHLFQPCYFMLEEPIDTEEAASLLAEHLLELEVPHEE